MGSMRQLGDVETLPSLTVKYTMATSNAEEGSE
jgi:hypothetical protein